MRTLIRGAVAALLALPLLLASSPSAQAAPDPRAMTSGFYVDPNSNPALWAAGNPSDGRASAIRSSIANTPMARWFGAWSGDIGSATNAYTGAAQSADKLPILVAYNIYGRDACGGHSGGGASSPAEYARWISAFAGGIGSRPAVVVLEPDALGDYSCMTPGQINERQTMLRNALAEFRSKAPNAWVYLDAGNPGWTDASTMADRLNAAGLGLARGFSLNVSNYFTTSQNAAYAGSINQVLGQRYGYSRPFVVDTSRNGNGSNGQWCNPAGRRIGTPTQQGGGGAEMLLWIKTPGESDGDCGVGSGSTAGQFLPEVAYRMIYGY
ncbi:glycoside hydrolase family 6 protein [Streptomyces marincola]|uniref:glycoside hydrolase family 6 protein n=1 Tax=Streptomyces marincola TaxID=2878388 RepID=UPI001CF10F8D|nr:glycoside hydrolase family 6 protein [Streptomyces marincola]UCM91608.1 glycoside hydrolase family 6 protein [Streptomyces marincola]